MDVKLNAAPPVRPSYGKKGHYSQQDGKQGAMASERRRSFGDNQPLDDRDTQEAYAKNRRIEVRLTDR